LFGARMNASTFSLKLRLRGAGAVKKPGNKTQYQYAK